MGSYWIDGVVLLAYFAIVMGIGLSQRSKSGSVEGFALGDRQTPWWAVLASILAAEISAATFLGAPESGFTNHNWTYAQFAIGTLIARIIVSYLFIPVFYRHGVVSLYEYLGTRFGPRTRTFASATFLVTRVLAMGTRLYVSAIILVLAYSLWKGGQVSNQEKFAIFAIALVFITMATAAYTAIGGIRAVIWTDFLQVGVLVAALGFTIWFLLGQIPGGMETVTAQIQHPAFFITQVRVALCGGHECLLEFATVPREARQGHTGAELAQQGFVAHRVRLERHEGIEGRPREGLAWDRGILERLG